ncbi:THAP domain-containing protein 1-like [Pseudomyrmex gracilis]|uniref:THAP domain-containing protein 1-like n=1 Tax=Pseudomyrmex gracilis TaxID=219809 RepID=UPI000994DDE8|nr:THAP domain-containing protein 1-like [Pseudomyrmex gracilis]
MPSSCCIPQCKNITKNGFHLFRFPLNRPDILQLWIAAIGRDNFKLTKYSLICSAHFQENDFMKRPNASGVRLNNLAVPSIFCAPISADVTASAIETPSIEFNTTLASTSAVVPEIKWKSILKPKEDNSKENTSTSNTTIKMHMHKSRTIMSNSLLKVKKMEMSPRKKLMWRTIKSLKQKLKRKEDKISSLKNLLKTLRYDKKV